MFKKVPLSGSTPIVNWIYFWAETHLSFVEICLVAFVQSCRQTNQQPNGHEWTHNLLGRFLFPLDLTPHWSKGQFSQATQDAPVIHPYLCSGRILKSQQIKLKLSAWPDTNGVSGKICLFLICVNWPFKVSYSTILFFFLFFFFFLVKLSWP